MIKVKNYDEFTNEGFFAPIASLVNTPGMGNVTSSPIGAPTNTTGPVDGGGESADQDRALRHIDPWKELAERDNAWMKPHGNYQNRGWILPNFKEYTDVRQSNTRFSIGDEVRCIDSSMESYGRIGKIVAFEDNTIRWEILNSATGVGQTAKQYRCHASALEPIQPQAHTVPC